LICVVTNTAKAYELEHINTADDLYWYSYQLLTQRFQHYIQDLERLVSQKLNGMVVCDHRGAKDDARLRELHHKLMNTTSGVISEYGNMVEGVFIAPSHLSVGIQFADMVAGAVFRAFSKQDLRYFNQINNAFWYSPESETEGFGLVKFPKGW
jgi:hypothetical protein